MESDWRLVRRWNANLGDICTGLFNKLTMKDIAYIRHALGIICILIGIFFQLVLLWNEMKPKNDNNIRILQEGTVPDFTKIILAIIDKLPWLSVAGFILFYAGIELLKS